MRPLIHFLLTELKSSIEREHQIIKLLTDLSREYKLRIDIENCKVLDWGILKNKEEVNS